jgi:thioredoxin-like negative regulator of GroEL
LLLLLLAPVSALPGALSAEVEAKSRAYYHFALGHYYEELAGPFRRSAYLREAIDHYKKALQYDPNSTLIVIQLAEAYRTSGSTRDAVVEARQLLEKDPDNLAAHRLLGRIYFQTLGELEPATPTKDTLRLALEEYQHITRLSPDDTDAWLMLARLHRMNSDLDGTEAALKEVLVREPQSEAALATLAALYTDRGEHDKATELLEAAAEDAASSRLLGALGYAYDQAGEVEKAMAMPMTRPARSRRPLTPTGARSPARTISSRFGAGWRMPCCAPSTTMTLSSNTRPSSTPIPRTPKPTSASRNSSVFSGVSPRPAPPCRRPRRPPPIILRLASTKPCSTRRKGTTPPASLSSPTCWRA